MPEKPGPPSNQRQDEERNRLTLMKAMGVASVAGLDLALSILFGVLVGLFADSHLHSSPWGLFIGLLLGLSAGLYTLYRLIAPIVRSI